MKDEAAVSATKIWDGRGLPPINHIPPPMDWLPKLTAGPPWA